MKKITAILLLLCLFTAIYPLKSRGADSLLSVSQQKLGKELWDLLRDNYQRYDSIGCEWSDWSANGLDFRWLNRHDCQVNKDSDGLEVFFYNYHLVKDRPLTIILITQGRWLIFTAHDQDNGAYYSLDPSRKTFSFFNLFSDRRYQHLEKAECRQFNATIKKIVRSVSDQVAEMRD